MTTDYQASCYCQAVKITIHGRPSNAIACHCSVCQKGAGGSYQAYAAYPTKDLEFIDPDNKLKKYHIPKTATGSGQEVIKGFCGECGTNLYNQPLALGGELTVIKATVIEIPEADAALFKPQAELFTKNRLAYNNPIEEAAQFEGAYSA